MGEMIAQNASNKDSRSLNEPRDVGRRKRIGHSPPNEYTGHVPRSPPRDVAAAFLENIQAKVAPATRAATQSTPTKMQKVTPCRCGCQRSPRRQKRGPLA